MSPDDADADELIQLELGSAERQMLVIALVDWGGPAYGSEPLAQAMGFGSLERLYDESQLLADAIRRKQPLSRRDWTRAIVATEIGFVSVLGTGCGTWESVHGGRAERWFGVLLRLQSLIPAGRDFLPE